MRLANIVCVSSHTRANKLPIPSPLCAEVGTNEMYSRGFLFSWNRQEFKPCKKASTVYILLVIYDPLVHVIILHLMK